MHFSFKEVLHTGWSLFKKNWKFILLLGFSTSFLQILIDIVQQSVMYRSPLLGFVLWVTGTVLSIIITFGWAKVNLALVSHHTANWNTFRSSPEDWIRLVKVILWSLAYSVYYALIVLVPIAILGGIALFIDSMFLQKITLILGAVAFAGVALYITIRFQFATLAAVEATAGNSKTIFKKSVALTDGQFFYLLGWLLVSALVILGGILLAGIGLIVALPVVTIAQTKIYTILKSNHHSSVAV